MYGTTASGATGATLAYTGLAAGSTFLAFIGVAFVVLGVFMLLKKNSKARP